MAVRWGIESGAGRVEFWLEYLFAARPTPPPVQCGFGQFRCRDGTCIPSLQRCQGKVDCASGDDEENCRKDLLKFWFLVLRPLLLYERVAWFNYVKSGSIKILNKLSHSIPQKAEKVDWWIYGLRSCLFLASCLNSFRCSTGQCIDNRYK